MPQSPDFCTCMAKTCTPSTGENQGISMHYPGDGSLTRTDDGVTHHWCFVEESCTSKLTGNGDTCDGAKFAFLDGWDLDSYNGPIVIAAGKKLPARCRCSIC